MITTDKPLTTGNIATYCGVSRMGVLRWIKNGQLKAHRTPGGHFRITHADFRAFLDSTNFPNPSIPKQSNAKRILLITQNITVLGSAVRLLSTMPPPSEIDVAMDCSTAITKMAVFNPTIVILDGSNDNCNLLDFVRKTKRSVETNRPLPSLLLAKTTLIPAEISSLAEMFSPIILEPVLPSELDTIAATRFKSTIQRLLLD